MKYDLSVLVPARNEEFLARTIDEVLAKRRGRTEVICVLDGQWPVEPIPDHPDVTLVHQGASIGQRAAINQAARLSTAEYVMKLDAHCALDEGFDVKLMADCEPDWTVVPRLYNLHAFDWKCLGCGNQTYQGPKPDSCSACLKKTHFERVIIWQPRWSRKTDFMRFDSELVFKYWGEFGKREEGKADIADTMSLLGACFFMRRERYWELGGSDEGHGSWGQQGTEIALKSWLSGGRLVVNKKTWYSHLFRTQPGFGFPYPNPGLGARDYSRDLWMNNKWEGQKYPLSWLVEKFAPVPSWHEEEGKEALAYVNEQGRKFYADRGRKVPEARPQIIHKSEPSKGIVFYTDNRLDERIACAVRKQIKTSMNGHRLVSVSLKPLEFGENLTLGRARGIRTMFEQILAGLSELDTDYAFLCEHDVLYHKSHFEFTPPTRDAYYYNMNVWKVDAETGRALHYLTKQTSGLCADRELLVEHYRKRLDKMAQNVRDLQARGETVKNDGYSRHTGFEPGCHRYPRGVDSFPALEWWSEGPNIDIRHTSNLTPSRWRQEQFRNPDACLGWEESDSVPLWGRTLGRFREFLEERGL